MLFCRTDQRPRLHPSRALDNAPPRQRCCRFGRALGWKVMTDKGTALETAMLLLPRRSARTVLRRPNGSLTHSWLTIG